MAPIAGGLAAVTESSPLSASLEELFLGRVRALPEDTQRLVLLAAADSSGEPALVRRAAERLRIGINVRLRPALISCSASNRVLRSACL
jgi:hypothetical protein